MDAALGPATHCEVKEVPETNRTPIAEHVVVLIHVKDEPRSPDNSALHSIHPSLECLVMVFHNEVNWAGGPGEQSVEFFDRLIKETKVV